MRLFVEITSLPQRDVLCSPCPIFGNVSVLLGVGGAGAHVLRGITSSFTNHTRVNFTNVIAYPGIRSYQLLRLVMRAPRDSHLGVVKH